MHLVETMKINAQE